MLSFDLLDPLEPEKTAGVETLSLAALVAAAITGSAQMVPVLKRLQATNPQLYATIIAAAAAEATARLQQGAAAAQAAPPQQGPPNVLPPPFSPTGILL